MADSSYQLGRARNIRLREIATNIFSVLMTLYEQYVQKVSTPVLDPGVAYSAGDVLVATTLLQDVAREDAGLIRLESLIVFDAEDQAAQALDIYFFDSNVTLGTINEAISISDADALHIIGKVSIATTDFEDTINSKIGFLYNQNVLLRLASDINDVYYAVVTAGTPTYTGNNLTFKFEFKQIN